MIDWQWLSFYELSADLLYDILRLRESVFTFEQKCNIPDIDGLDKLAIHLIGKKNSELIVCAYVLPPKVRYTDFVSFGRLVIAPKFRGQGIGKQAMQHIIDYLAKHYPEMPIKVSSQFYLVKFYQDFGFQTCGEPYDEGGILHITMLKE